MKQRELPSTVTSLSITVASCSDKGRVREHNEDAIALCDPPDQLRAQQLGSLYLLADGAGGHAAGEVASRIAVETIFTVYYHQTAPLEEVADPAQLRYSSQCSLNTACIRLQQAFLAAHARIRQLAHLKEEYVGMATTCLAAVVQETRVLIAHVGDSRAYLIRSLGGSLPAVTRLTTDHSLATELARAGIISREQSDNSPARHILLRVLGGSKQNIEGPDISICEVHAGDCLVLCCDGLWSLLTEAQIARAVNSNPPQAACTELIRLANEAGGQDNISVVVLAFRARDV